MARKKGGKQSGQPKAGSARRGRPGVNRRSIKRNSDTTQLLERGEGATAEEQVDPGVDAEVSLGGGVNPDAGSPEDAPRYGDWGRHSTGSTSGARGREGLGFPGERTWGEAQYSAERREEQGRSRPAPRSARRSDDRLADDIRDILTNDPELDARDIEVEVEGGAVTLSGAVADSDAKLLAEELVETLPGVREIHNRLRVEPRED
jgi:hypothetical protein